MAQSRKDIVHQWLVRNKGRLPSIAQQAGVKLSWVYAFKDGKIQRPGFDQIDALYRAMEAEARETLDAISTGT